MLEPLHPTATDTTTEYVPQQSSEVQYIKEPHQYETPGPAKLVPGPVSTVTRSFEQVLYMI